MKLIYKVRKKRCHGSCKEKRHPNSKKLRPPYASKK